MKKLTPWFPMSMKPVRNGVYQVKPPSYAFDDEWLSLYRNGVWHGTCGPTQTVEYTTSFGKRHGKTDAELLGWRGLAKAPK